MPGAEAGQDALALEQDLEELADYVRTFPERCTTRLGEWKQRLEGYREGDKKVVLWGSGSKGVSFLTTLDVGEQIAYVVDINPYRQGYYMSGTGQRIVAPDFLKEYRPDTVIVMNPVYKEEIARDLSGIGLTPEIVTL